MRGVRAAGGGGAAGQPGDRPAAGCGGGCRGIAGCGTGPGGMLMCHKVAYKN